MGYIANRLEGYRLRSEWLAYDQEVSFLLVEGATKGMPVVASNDFIQAFYVALRLDGEQHAFAEMVANMQPPMSDTDREFLEGHCNGSQFAKEPHIGDGYAKLAKKMGVDVTGKVYISGLAEYPGDPKAWVSGKGDVRRVCEERGWNCRGAVNVKSEMRQEPQSVGLSRDVVEEKVNEYLDSVPEVDRAAMRVSDIREQVIDRIAPHWVNKSKLKGVFDGR